MAAAGESLYGTHEPPVIARNLTCGPLAVEIEADAIRSIAWHGTEVLRGFGYPIRDRDWGTHLLRTLDEMLDATQGSYCRVFETEDGSIEGTFRLQATASGQLTAEIRYIPRREVQVCRAGFAILHPIEGLAGRPLDVRHSDGGTETTVFPDLISPAQPVKAIRGLSYARGGLFVEIEAQGDIFEMEDQRNWSDASYKTYCRPLALPYPFRMAAGQEVVQRLIIRCAGGRIRKPLRGAGAGPFAWQSAAAPLPEPMLAIEDGWAAVGGPAMEPLGGLGRLIRLDLRTGSAGAPVPPGLAEAQDFDLELVTSDDRDAMEAELRQLAESLARLGRQPRHVIALPSAYLASYQPDGQWPSGATPAAAVEAARTAFPGARIGGGMLTNFTELNRRRPDPDRIDYLTHGTTAIVHAADDRSVIETLECLPHIYRSARAIAPGKPYRLGLVSIGMRSNPYGTAVAANPAGVRKAMAQDDPRHRGLFGAAWLAAAVATTDEQAVEAMALAAPTGPFGVVDASASGTTALRPCYHFLRALAAMRHGQRLVALGLDPAVRLLASRSGTNIRFVAANLSTSLQRVTLPAPARFVRLDSETMADAAQDASWTLNAKPSAGATIELPPFALAFAVSEA